MPEFFLWIGYCNDSQTRGIRRWRQSTARWQSKSQYLLTVTVCLDGVVRSVVWPFISRIDESIQRVNLYTTHINSKLSVRVPSTCCLKRSTASYPRQLAASVTFACHSTTSRRVTIYHLATGFTPMNGFALNKFVNYSHVCYLWIVCNEVNFKSKILVFNVYAINTACFR